MMASLRYGAFSQVDSCDRMKLICASSTYYQFILSQGKKIGVIVQSVYVLTSSEGVCSPLGASLIFYPAMSSVGTWFHKNRAFAFGVMAAGSSLGGVIFPIMVDRLVAQHGFAWAMRVAAFLILGLLIFANLTVKSRLKPTIKPWSFMEFVDPFRELPFVLTLVAAFFFFFGMFLPFTFLILEAEYYGMSRNLAAYLVSILNAGRCIDNYHVAQVGNFLILYPGQYRFSVAPFPASSPTASADSTR